jgi:hypothetical protein
MITQNEILNKIIIITIKMQSPPPTPKLALPLMGLGLFESTFEVWNRLLDGELSMNDPPGRDSEGHLTPETVDGVTATTFLVMKSAIGLSRADERANTHQC